MQGSQSVGPKGTLPSVIGAYLVEGVLGRGASGLVLRVRDEALDRSIALKLLTDDLDADARARFLIEAKAAARIVHPNVVQVFAVGNHEGRAFITQELVEGYPLSMLLDARGKLSPEAVVDIALQVASGLARAAEVGVLHRDVKPQNLLITEEGLVKLADFGLAKIMNAPSHLTDTGTTLGTPHYMSPEQGQGLELDPRCDQYSLGATLYHLLTGRPPFDDANALALLRKHHQDPLVPILAVASDVPPALAEIVEKMLAKSPNDRFESFDALAEALEVVAQADEDHDVVRGLLDDIEREEEEVSAAAEEAPPPEVAGGPRLPTWLVPVAVLVAAGAVGAAVLFGGSHLGTTSARVRGVRTEVPLEVAAPPQRDPFEPKKVAPERKIRKRIKKRSPATTKADVLLKELGDPKAGPGAARELGRLGDHRATNPLIRALESKDEGLAVAAAEALGELGDIDAIEPLGKIAEAGRTKKIRQAARQAKLRLWSVEEP